MSEKKHKKISARLTYAYLRHVKKWMLCPCCQNGKMRIDKASTMWTCENCDYELSADEFEDDYVFWFCDECEAYLNDQDGFDRNASKHICQNCGYENDTTLDNIKGICSDCGKVIADPEATLCEECKELRKKKAKQWLAKAGKVVGIAAAVAGTIYIAYRLSDGQSVDYEPLPDDDNDNNEDDGNIQAENDAEPEEIFSQTEETMDDIEEEPSHRKYHMISAKRMGWEQIYDYYAFPTDKFTKEEAQAQFTPVKKETLKNNNRWYEYTAYDIQGTTYYKTIYDGVYDEDELLARGYTKEELDQM
ncbi:MAG: hypothetical protein LUD18_03055 [Lachnospiraceae bacterium]|nr:hypothetical protein [Lachnospiraceae bacterium]